jgi:hypothetical protein
MTEDEKTGLLGYEIWGSMSSIETTFFTNKQHPRIGTVRFA